MQDCPRIPMEKTSKIMRKSIYTFLQNYHYFTATAAVLAFPYSLSLLLSSQPILLLPSSSTYNRLRTLFHAAGFPPSSEFFNILSLKLSQTISSSISTLPFTLTFLLLAKASIIQALKTHKPSSSSSPPSFSCILSLFNPLLFTYICNSFFILSANATVFSLLFFAFSFLQGPNCVLFLSAAGAVVYSIVVANAFIICNLALVLSGMERCSGYMAILKACVVMRGRASTALSLALPVNLAMAGVEALFQYRIARDYKQHGGKSSMALEGMLISYMYSVCVVIDTVVSCMFYKSCKAEAEAEGGYSYQIEIVEEYRGDLNKSQDFP